MIHSVEGNLQVYECDGQVSRTEERAEMWSVVERLKSTNAALRWQNLLLGEEDAGEKFARGGEEKGSTTPRLRRQGSDSEAHKRFMMCVMMSLPTRLQHHCCDGTNTRGFASLQLFQGRVSVGVSVQFLQIP